MSFPLKKILSFFIGRKATLISTCLNAGMVPTQRKVEVNRLAQINLSVAVSVASLTHHDKNALLHHVYLLQTMMTWLSQFLEDLFWSGVASG
jgi:hypothetical protein